MKVNLILFLSIVILTGQTRANDFGVKVKDLKGKAEIRKGLDENWSTLEQGMQLKDIDTILTGNGAKIILEVDGGKQFILTENCILHVGDLRTIKEKELFLYLMSNKIDELAPVEKKKIQIGNVSVVHGSNAKLSQNTESMNKLDWVSREKNGAKALFKNQLYTNTIMKMSRMIMEYDSIPQPGELYYYMGRSFEAIDNKGQAIDHYEKAIENSDSDISDDFTQIAWINDAKKALDRLKKE